MNWVANIAAAIAVAILRYLQSREDLKTSIRLELEREVMGYAIKATEWKARAVGLPFASHLVVRNATLSISLQSPDACAGSDAQSVGVRNEGSGGYGPEEGPVRDPL